MKRFYKKYITCVICIIAVTTLLLHANPNIYPDYGYTFDKDYTGTQGEESNYFGYQRPAESIQEHTSSLVDPVRKDYYPGSGQGPDNRNYYTNYKK